MSDQRKPLEGWTYDPEPTPTGYHLLFDVNGCGVFHAAPDRFIPAPPEPRTGRLGLTEADTRKTAALESHSNHIAAASLHARRHNANVAICREDVAEWDAADNAEPDTLTVTLPPFPLADVRFLAADDWCTSAMRSVADACRAALTEAGLS